MFDKKEIKCLKTIKAGPFFHEYLVYFDSTQQKKKKFRLRVMYKKSIVENKDDEEMVINELQIRTRLRHPFLINQVCAFQDYDNLFYLTEYAPIKLLKNDVLKPPFDMRVVRFYGAEIFSCLSYLHKRKQIYTFLSPENVLLDEDGQIRLDYSFCNCLNEKNDEMLELIEYVSLDYFKTHNFSIAGDYWSFGIVLYFMAFGYTPFGGETKEDTIMSMEKGVLDFPDWADEDFVDLVSRLLVPDMNERLGSSIEDALYIAKHPFFNEIDWESLESKKCQTPYLPSVINVDFENAPSLSILYTSDFIDSEKDGYGDTFTKFNTIHFLKRN